MSDTVTDIVTGRIVVRTVNGGIIGAAPTCIVAAAAAATNARFLLKHAAGDAGDIDADRSILVLVTILDIVDGAVRCTAADADTVAALRSATGWRDRSRRVGKERVLFRDIAQSQGGGRRGRGESVDEQEILVSKAGVRKSPPSTMMHQGIYVVS